MNRAFLAPIVLAVLCAACASSSTTEVESDQAVQSVESEQPGSNTEEQAPVDAEESATENAETVTLNFDWSAGLDGAVRVVSERKIDVPGEPENVRTKQNTFDVDVEQNAKGHLDVFFEHESLVGIETPAGEGAKEDYLLKRYKMLWMPAFRVSMQSGGITEVLRMEQLRAGHEAMLEQFAPEGEDESKRLRAAMAGMSPEKVAMNLATKRWNVWVAFWQGAELEIGAAYEVAQPGTPKVVFRAVQWVPCDAKANASVDVVFDESAPRECVELLIEQPLPEQALLAAMNPVIAALDKEGDTKFDSVNGTDWTSVICDPDTLIPYSVDNVREMEMKMTIDGTTAEASILATESAQFDWKNAPAPGE